MSLSDKQKQAVAGWVQEGASLAEVQRRLGEEFELNLTYMDVRFLVDDLEIILPEDSKKDAPSASDALDKAPATPAAPPPPSPAQGEAAVEEPEIVDEGGQAAGGVSVTVDKLQTPGYIVSGEVTFSDGTKGGWGLDQMGRLALRDVPEGYQPPEADLPVFQRELQQLLQKQGF